MPRYIIKEHYLDSHDMVVIVANRAAIELNETDFLQNEPNLILFYFTKAWPETLEGPAN